ncbi:hypothetical protein O4H52_07865 [Sphingomonadaceae bacterium G21617-S1]|nr:hypothetical protein [Sphingomonadaceae bacterium G21617-S1]
MRMITTAAITEAALISSNVLESGVAAYNSGTSYAAGDIAGVTVDSTITIYDALPIRNLIARSAEIDHASWVKSALSVSANAIANPVDGAVTADKIIPDNTAALHFTRQPWLATVQAYAGSIYVKAAEYSVIGVGLINNGANAGDAVNLATGAIIAAGGMSNSPFSQSAGTTVVALGNGWYRLLFTRAPFAAGNYNVGIYIIPNGTDYQSAGDGTSGVYAFGGHVESGTLAGSYQPTGASGGVNVGNAPASSATWWRERSVTYPVYSGATSYAIGDKVISTTTHRIYQSLVAANSGNALTDVSKWADIGPTNRWAPFDQKVGTKTARVGDISYTLTPGTADALAVLDTNAESATLVIKVGATVVYTVTKYLNVSGAAITDWLAYFTAPVGAKTNITFENLPLYASSTWQITINGRNATSYVSVGTIAIGAVKPLGKTEAGAKVGIIDFTKKTVDQFGVISATERGFSKRMTVRSLIDTDDVDSVNVALAAVRAVPAIYLGETGFDSLLCYGFWKDYEIDIADGRRSASGQLLDGAKSFLSITLESLTTSL